MKSQLLCTFTTIEELPMCIGSIHNFYEKQVVSMQCYCYVHDTRSVICTYNVYSKSRGVKNTISINRKKETNTLYSINALNAIIVRLNNGILDKNYRINWFDYVDSLVLGDGGDGYKVIQIKQLSA